VVNHHKSKQQRKKRLLIHRCENFPKTVLLLLCIKARKGVNASIDVTRRQRIDLWVEQSWSKVTCVLFPLDITGWFINYCWHYDGHLKFVLPQFIHQRERTRHGTLTWYK